MDITQVNTTNSRMKGLSNTTAYLWLTVNYSANSYTLTLNNGNASAIASVSGGGTKVYGSSCTATATLQTTAGYTFAFTNWTSSNTSLLANSTNRVYTFTMPAGNVTLTANGTRTVNYYPLTLTSGSYIASTSGGGSKAYNSSVTVNATVSTAAGYTTTFDGWYEGSTRKSTSTSYTFTMPANALTLQARATRSANQYNITWDANSGSANQTTSQTFAASIVLPVTTPVRQGYTFKGWFTAASGGVQITAQTIYETAGTTTYYAQWEPSGGLYYDAGDSFLPCLIYWCTDNAWQLCMAYYWNGQQWTMIGL